MKNKEMEEKQLSKEEQTELIRQLASRAQEYRNMLVGERFEYGLAIVLNGEHFDKEVVDRAKHEVQRMFYPDFYEESQDGKDELGEIDLKE